MGKAGGRRTRLPWSGLARSEIGSNFSRYETGYHNSSIDNSEDKNKKYLQIPTKKYHQITNYNVPFILLPPTQRARYTTFPQTPSSQTHPDYADRSARHQSRHSPGYGD